MTDSARQSTAGSVPITVVKAVADGSVVLGTDGVLRVGGTASGEAITISLVKTRGQSTVQVTSGSISLGSSNPSSIKEVRAWGQGGNDQIRISGLSVPAMLVGGAGDDSLTGGGGQNVIFGGSGRDSISGGAQSDFLVGGADSDIVLGSGGNDVLIGGELARRWTLDDARGFLSSWSAGGSPQNTRDLSVLDAAIDDLQGGSGRDLFVVGQGDSNDVNKKDKDVLLVKG